MSSHDSGTKSSPAGNGIVEIAHRIRDLAEQVEKEQSLLKVAQKRSEDLKEQEQREILTNYQKRCEYLKLCNARNDVELEIFATKQQIAAYKKAVENFNREREEMEQKVLPVEEEGSLRIERFYAPQQVKMDMFLGAMETAIQAKQDKIKEREAFLASIRAETKELKAQEKATKMEMGQVRKDLAHLLETQVDAAEDHELSDIFTHNQSLIKERAALRKKLTKAQRANNKATESLAELEEEGIYLRTNGNEH
ncbi:MAG: hypothetical protein SGARI_006175 [Bacillariaceae sp.]